MKQLFYVYGLKEYQDATIAVLTKHNLLFNILLSLHSEGFEIEIPVILPNPEFNAAVGDINNILSCWVQPTRKGDFLAPDKPFIKTYTPTTSYELIEAETKIIHSALIKCNDNTGGLCSFGVRLLSDISDPTSYKRLWKDSYQSYTSVYEVINLNTLYIKRHDNTKASLLLVEGVE